MLPDNTLTELDSAEFLAPRSNPYQALECWELGGVALSDTSQPFAHNWHGYVDGKIIYLKQASDNAEPVAVLGFLGEVTELSFSFDQNMRPIITYVEDGVAKLYWYDTSAAQNTLTVYPDIKNPRLSLDDKRRFNVGGSDIIFAYVTDHNRLCYRLQRERYGTEHELMVDESATVIKPLKLFRIGMTTANRFLFETS